jgi:hypothetical protein
LLLALDVCLALRFRDAVLFDKPVLAWRDAFATHRANSGLGLSEQHRYRASDEECNPSMSLLQRADQPSCTFGSDGRDKLTTDGDHSE